MTTEEIKAMMAKYVPNPDYIEDEALHFWTRIKDFDEKSLEIEIIMVDGSMKV